MLKRSNLPIFLSCRLNYFKGMKIQRPIKKLYSTLAPIEQEVNYKIKNTTAIVELESKIKNNLVILNSYNIQEMEKCIKKGQGNDKIKAIVISSKSDNSFIYGSDRFLNDYSVHLKENTEKCESLLTCIKDSNKPIICLIKGSCFGSGLEVALASQYRIAVNTNDTLFGFPYLKSGIFPESKVIEKLSTIISFWPYVSMVVYNKNVNAIVAKELGIVDELVQYYKGTEEEIESLAEKALKAIESKERNSEKKKRFLPFTTELGKKILHKSTRYLNTYLYFKYPILFAEIEKLVTRPLRNMEMRTKHLLKVEKASCGFSSVYRDQILSPEYRWNFFNAGKSYITRDETIKGYNMFNNDYFSLLNEQRLIEVQANSILNNENSILMSRYFGSDNDVQSILERKFADYLLADDCIITQSGYKSNAGILETISGPQIPVYADQLAHASFHSGIRLARAPFYIFKNNDTAHLQYLLNKNGPGIVVVESVYSVTGSVANLKDIVDVVERNHSAIVVDESHSLGTHGPNGRGLTVKLNLQDRVHFRTASLSKTFAGRAGMVTVPKGMRYSHLFKASHAAFSSSLMNHELKWFNEVIDMMPEFDDRRERVIKVANMLRNELAKANFRTLPGTEQIIAVDLGPDALTQIAIQIFEENGVFGAFFTFPAVKLEQSVLRLTVNSSISEEDTVKIGEKFRKIRQHEFFKYLDNYYYSKLLKR